MSETADPNSEDDRTDIATGNWVDRFAPAPTRPYLRLARLDRPIGTWLLLLPCWWSVALAAPLHETPGYGLWLFTLFAIGATVMRGAGCTLNDIADRNYDGQVARTATRPIPSGAVSVKQAVAFMGFLCLLGLAVLTQFNLFAVAVGVASLGLVAVYPFAKRVTYWPQAVLGLTFNWGALLGWAAVRGDLDLAPVLLYIAGLFWTLGYDTIYAHQDKEDDVLIGVKSTALKLGDATPRWLIMFYGLQMVLTAAAGHFAGLAWPFYVGLALAGAHLVWQIAKVDIHNPADCLDKFKSNRDFGLILLAAIMAGHLAL